MEWPNFYPENCPPAEAEPAFGTVYRLVQHDPALAEDFRSTWEECPGRFEEPTIINSGVSIYTDPQDIERLKNRYKKKFSKYKMAEGELNPTLGVIQHTPSSLGKSHHTWWVPVRAEPWNVFNIIGG